MNSTSGQAKPTPSEQIVSAVAASADSDPTTLPPLFDAVDPDALDRLAGDGVRIVLEYSGHDVVVNGDRSVDVVYRHDRE